MQRIGLLTVVTLAASPQKMTDLDGISRDVQDILRRRCPIPSNLRVPVAQYVNDLKLFSRYPQLKGLDVAPDGFGAELQDIWLAQDGVPSATGAMTDTNTHELPQWAASVGLVRDVNYTRTLQGRLALALMGEDQIAGIRAADSQATPLSLHLGMQMAYAYYLLSADFDFVGVSYDLALSKLGTSFSRMEFSSLMAEVCRRLISDRSFRVSEPDHARLRSLADEIDKYVKPEAPGSPATRGGARPPANTATVRLEPYVDLGLLAKPDSRRYRYEMSTRQARFFDWLAQSVGAAESIERMRSQFVGRFLDALGVQASPVDEYGIQRAIVDAYRELEPAGGYSSFQEVVLMAIARLVEADPPSYFEVEDGVRIIHEMRKKDPRNVRFGTGRDVGMSFFRLKGSACE